MTFDLQRFDNPGGTVGNITWEIVNDVLTVIGEGSISSSPWFYDYREAITSVVVNEGITHIGDWAFQGCTNLTSVSLPSTVTDIEGTAFYGIDFPENFSVTIAMPIGKMITYAGSQIIFADENGTADITKIVTQQHTFSFADLPSGTCGDNLTWAFDGHKLTISGTGAMSDNTYNDSWWYDYRDAITTVEIGDGVTSIGKKAFEDCRSLSSVTIPATLETIGDSAFYNCKSLPATLDLSGTRLTTIGSEVFSKCTSLERMILPDTVTYIGRYAFQNCADNLSVVIAVFDDEKVTMGGNTLTPTDGYIDITSLVGSYSTISYSIGGTCGDNLTWAFDGGKLTISGNGEMSFTEAPWKNRLAQITSVEIGSGVTKIISVAFNGCENLQSVTVAVPSDKTLTINGKEYTPSSGTINITPLFADDLTDDLTISSFYGGTSDNITWKLTDDGTLTISGTGEIYNFPWQSYRNQIKTAVIGEGITFISGAAFYGYSNLTSVILPEGTTAVIGYELLNDSENLLDGLKYKYLSTGVTLTTTAASEVTYTDANGNAQTVLAFALGNDITAINKGTYFVTGTVNLESLTINGYTRIILGDGAKLNVSGEISTENDLLICGGGEVTAESFSAASVTFDRNFSDGTNLYKSGTAYSISAGGTFTAFDAYELDIQLDGAEISCTDDDKITLGDKTYYKVGATITITIPDGEKLFINGNEVSGTVKYTMPAQDTLLTEPPSIGELKTDADGNEYYSVTKAIHLVTLAEQVNGGKSFEGVTFKLEKDIDLSKIENFTPIGFDENDDYDYYFSGTFDGGGHKISGLTINLPDNECVGLFGYVSGGTVKNVALENVNVTGGSWGVGALIGYCEDGTVENCSVIGGTVSGENGVGGLVGDSDDDTCIISGNTVSNVSVSATGSYAWVGGLVGNNDGSISGNTVDAQITVGENSWVGGLVGDNCGGTITGNTVDAQITAGDDSYVGGVVGCDEYNNLSSSTVKNNFFHSTAGDAIGGYDDYDGEGADIRDNERLFALELPEGVTASGDGVKTVNGKLYAAGSVTLNAPEGYTLNNITVNGTTISGNTFTISDDTNITADVTDIADEPETEDTFNAAGTAVIVGGTTGNFSANSALYSITASQQNSTLIANAKANQIIVAGGNENILTGGKGNDTFKFSAGGGIVTDYGIGATKSGDGKALTTASGTDIVKVDGKVTGIYFDRDASSKKSATFTATIVYGDDQVVVLKDIAKKPTKTGSSPIYQTNDVAVATLKIWDTSNTKQAVLSSTKLKKLFHDDNDSAFTDIIKDKTDYLINLSENKPNATNPFSTQLTFTGNNKN